MTAITDNDSSSGLQHLKVVERMHSYPIVTDSLVFALGYYNWIKSKNSLLDASFSRIEDTLKSFKEPISTDKLKFIDDTVSNQLVKLEKLCPMILEPSPPITTIQEKLYSKTIEPSMKAIMWPFSKTFDLVSKTSSATVSTMSSVLESSMNRVRPVSRSVTETTHSMLDITDEIVDNILPGEDKVSDEEDHDLQRAELAQTSVYTKVKRLSVKTQQRLYNIAISEINALQKISVAKIARLHSLVQEMQGKRTTVDEDRVVEGCESCNEPVKSACMTPPSPKPELAQEASSQIEQLQEIMSAVANIKNHATTNTLISLHFINTNLSLLKTVLIVNEKLLHQTIVVLDKVQWALEYVMVKIKAYLKSQRLSQSRTGKVTKTCIVCESDSE